MVQLIRKIETHYTFVFIIYVCTMYIHNVTDNGLDHIENFPFYFYTTNIVLYLRRNIIYLLIKIIFDQINKRIISLND